MYLLKNLGGNVHWGADWTTCISRKRTAPLKSTCVLYQFLHVAYPRRNTSIIIFCPRYWMGPRWTLGCSHEQHRYSWWAIACKTCQKLPENGWGQVRRNSTLRGGRSEVVAVLDITLILRWKRMPTGVLPIFRIQADTVFSSNLAQKSKNNTAWG